MRLRPTVTTAFVVALTAFGPAAVAASATGDPSGAPTSSPTPDTPTPAATATRSLPQPATAPTAGCTTTEVRRIIDGITEADVQKMITSIVVDPKTGKETPRVVGSQAIKDRQAWLKTQLESWGAKVTMQPFPGAGDTQATNVIGSITGLKADPKKVISLSGHLDTTETSPGANDDASGVTGAMVAAKALAAAKDSPCLAARVDVVAFDNEEEGTDGAAPYIASLKTAGDTYLGGYNPDPFGRPSGDGECVQVLHNSERDKPHADLMIAANKKYNIGLAKVEPGTHSDADIDSYLFWQAGMPNVYPQDCSDNNSPHDPTDVLKALSVPQITKATKMMTAAVLELSSLQSVAATPPSEKASPEPEDSPSSQAAPESKPGEGEPNQTAQPDDAAGTDRDDLLGELGRLLDELTAWLDKSEPGETPAPEETAAPAPGSDGTATPGGDGTPAPTATSTAPPAAPPAADPAGVVTLPKTGVPPNPGKAVVKSPNPSPIATAAKLTGPRIRVSKGDNPEALLNGKTLAAGTVVEVERGAVFDNVRVVVNGAGTAAQPVLVTAVGTGPAPVFKASKPGPNGKDSGILTTTGTHVHVQGLAFADSGSVAVAANAAPTVLDSITGSKVVIGTWVKGDGSKVWNSYFHNLILMPDTPGANDDYGAAGVVVEANDVTIEGVTCRECHDPNSPDYKQYGGDGSFAEVWMKGDRLNIGWSYLDGGPRVLEAGGLGAGNSAQNMTVHNTYANVRKDAPFYFNPDGEYAGLNTSGFVEKDNTIVKS